MAAEPHEEIIMAGLFYQLGKKVGPKLRKAQWAWAAATAPEAEVIAAERAAGADLACCVRRERPVCADPELVERVTTIGAALAGRVKNKLRTFDFICLSGDTPEAFCLPGGFVFVSRPMIEMCGDKPDPLAFVLAHEIAHILEGHVMERMVGSAVIKMATQSGVVGHVVTGAMGKLGVQFLEKAYSREQEYAADTLGLRLAIAAGFDGQAALAVFEKLAALEQPGNPFKYFSTHPEAEDRIAHLRRLLAERPGSTPQ